METYRATRKKKMKPSQIDSGDRISKLPDPILHHILSFLDMRHAIETCILSRRWRYVWISVPILNFDERVFNSYLDSDDVRENIHKPSHGCFMDFVTRALHCRGACKIDEFHVSCQDKMQGMSIDLDDWMPMLTRRKVALIDIKANFRKSNSVLELPESFFKCKSLTTLKLDMGSRKRPFYKTPDVEYDLSPLRNLKTLHLRSFWLLGGVNEFIGLCPSLETLVIANCTIGMTNELHIRHYELKNLVIEKMSDGDSLDYCRIRVSASSLTSFSCLDYPINEYKLDCYSLEKANIDTDFGADYYLKPPEPIVPSKFIARDKDVYVRNVIDCLRGLRGVRSLTMSAWLLEIAIEAHKDRGILPMDQFSNLRCLTLKSSLSTNHTFATMNLLRKCPVLETLVVKMTKPPTPIRVDEAISSLGVGGLPKCEAHTLKVIECYDFEASTNELKFLNYLLKTATVLEKVIIYTSKKQSLSKQQALKRFHERLMASPRAASNVDILLL